MRRAPANINLLRLAKAGTGVYNRARMTLLQNIDSPADLRKLKIDQLQDVAEEIRQFILETMARVGGHTGASLGAIELAVALHYAFETPHDRLVWATGGSCNPPR